jgi:hypothetical protein
LEISKKSRKIAAGEKAPVKARRISAKKNPAKARRNLGEIVRLEKFLEKGAVALWGRKRESSPKFAPPFALGENQGANLHL